MTLGKSRNAFTLVELLVVMAVIAILATLATSIYTAVQRASQKAACMSKMRSMGNAMILYTQDNDGEYPRSSHSSFSFRVYPWGRAISKYMGLTDKEAPTVAEWTEILKKDFTCPAHKKKVATNSSYGMNVFYELRPEADDYEGSPETWRSAMTVPQPQRTILLAEMKDTSVDHIMAHFWSAKGDAFEVDQTRHGDTGSHYVFADGHVEYLTVAETFDPAKGINLWNPSLAK